MRKKRGIVWHIYPSYLLVTLLSLFAISWYLSDYVRHFFLSQAKADLETEARLLQPQFEPLLSASDHAGVDRLCKTIGERAITRITVILDNGVVIGDSEESPAVMDNHGNRPEVLEALEATVGSSIRYSATLGLRMMYVAVPFKGGDLKRVVLRTAVPLTSIDKEVKAIQSRIALGGVLVALLASAVCFFVARRISLPIENLKQGAENFSRGDLAHRLEPPAPLELARLAEAMNQMAARLEERIAALRDQHNELEAVLSSMTEGVIAVDTDERVISVNAAARSIFKLESVDFQEHSIQEMVRNRELHQVIRHTLGQGRKTERDISFFSNGEQVLHCLCTPLRNLSELQIGALVVVNDVTQLRRLENIRRDFAANVSHEIKTPLTAIKGFVETLCHEDAITPEESRRFLGIIEKHANRLTAIIDDLMQLSRIEREEDLSNTRPGKTTLKESLQTVVKLCDHAAEAKGISVVLVCQEEAVAQIDPVLFERVAVNLLDNAIKYSRENGQVRIEGSLAADEVCIRFKDRGIGIAKQHLPRLFERFYRVEKARSRQLGGTGLGLAIVKHIVQAYGGHIDVASKPGEGSTFDVYLPKA
jgi:two-component system phosphate regulon sensor histidine kinase PhoR